MLIPAGSRLLLAATLLAAGAAALYGATVNGTLGTVGLISAAAALAVLTGINLYTRDADVSAMDPSAITDSAAARPAPWSSLWPMVGALGGALVVLGLITYPVVFVFGLVALLAAAAEWMLQAWSERASADRAFNDEVRQRFSHPAEFPVLATLIFAVLVYSFSRIMLWLSKEGGPAVFGAIAALLLATGAVLSFRRSLGNAVVGAIAAVAAIGLVAGGVAAALAGEREMHVHETTADLAAEGLCGTEETEADENASQAIANKANLAAEVTLREDGTLVATALGLDDEVTTLTFPRSNPSNVRFRNESAEERRLLLDLGTMDVEDEETGETEAVPVQQCTTLVEEGGSQLLTVEVGRPSGEYGPYQFTVPGVDDQAIELVVP